MLERGDGRVLDELLRQVPVAEDPDEGGGQPAALVTQDVGQSLGYRTTIIRHGA